MAGSINLPSLVAKLRLDSREFRRGFDQAQNDTKRFSDRAAASMKTAGTAATKFVTLPLLGLGAAALKAGSDLNEQMNKVTVVFGESSKSVQTFAKAAATSFGISQRAALQAAGTFGNLFTALGIGQKSAADMSTRLVALASDLASFNDVNPEDVLEALRSGLVGEVEPLRRFGVSLSAARIEAEAFALGLAKPLRNATAIRAANLAIADATREVAAAQRAHGANSLEAEKAQVALARAQEQLAKALRGQKVELTAAQKAQAAYSVILKDTKTAQGDFARTSDSVANKQRQLRAEFENAAGALGTRLLPIGQKLLAFASDLIGKFNGLSPGMQDFIIKGGAIAIVLGPAVRILGGLTRGIGSLKRGIDLLRGTDRVTRAVSDALCAMGTKCMPAAAGGIGSVGREAEKTRGVLNKLPPVLGAVTRAAGSVAAMYAVGTVASESATASQRNFIRNVQIYTRDLRAGGIPALKEHAGSLQSYTVSLARAVEMGRHDVAAQGLRTLALKGGTAAVNAAAAEIQRLTGVTIDWTNKTGKATTEIERAIGYVNSGALSFVALNNEITKVPMDLRIRLDSRAISKAALEGKELDEILRLLPEQVGIRVITDQVRQGTLRGEHLERVLKGLPRPRVVHVITEAIKSGALKGRELDRVLRGLPKAIRTDVAAFIKARVTSITISEAAQRAFESRLKRAEAHTGGLITRQGVRRYHSGGRVAGADDEVPIVAHAGEFVLQKRAADALAPILPRLNALRSLSDLGRVFRDMPRLQSGGFVSQIRQHVHPRLTEAAAVARQQGRTESTTVTNRIYVSVPQSGLIGLRPTQPQLRELADLIGRELGKRAESLARVRARG